MLIIFSNLISLISVNTIVILYKGSICKYYFTLGSFFKKKSLKRLKKIEDFVSVIHMLARDLSRNSNREFSIVE